MDIGNILGKLESNSDKLGLALGSLGMLNYYGGGNAVEGISSVAMGIIKNPHIPDFQGVIRSLTSDVHEGNQLKTAIGAIIAGYLMKEVNIHPTLNRFGNFIEKAGIGVAEATALLTVLAFAGQFE